MNKTLTCAGVLTCAAVFASTSHAAVNVYFSSSATNIQAEFIATATTQYVANVTQSPYFAGTYSMTISGKRSYTPPVVSSPIADATAVDRCMTYGYVFGMENERADSMSLINWLSVDSSSRTSCNGYKTNQTTPANAFLQGCLTAYNVVASSISERNGDDPKILP